MLALKALPEPVVVPRRTWDRDLACACGEALPLGVRLGIRSRSRPVFEGRWSCSTRCLQQHVDSVVQRESQQGPMRGPHRHRVPLGLVLLASGAVEQSDLRRALALQHGTEDRIGDVLQRECGISEQKVAEALALQWGCNVATARGVHAETAAAIMPRVILRRYGMLPLRVDGGGRLHIAFAHGVDAQAVFSLQRMHGVPLHVGIAPVGEWTDTHRRVMEADGVPAEEVVCCTVDEMAVEAARTIRRLQPVESRWVRIHDLHWLRLWLEPLALAGGPAQRDDVVDVVYRMPGPTLKALT